MPKFRSVDIVSRPYVLDFGTPFGQYSVTSDEVRNLVANYPIFSLRPRLLRLRGDDGRTVSIYPGSLDSAVCFVGIK